MGQPRFHTSQATSQTERHAILSKGNYSCKWAKGSVHSRSHNNLIKGSKRESVEQGVGGGQWEPRGRGWGGGGEGGFEESGGATIMAIRLKCATKSAFAEKKNQGRLGWRQGRGVDI